MDGADVWLRADSGRRTEIEALYGKDAALVREEAVARMGEAAFSAGLMMQRPAARVYGRLVNAVEGIGKMLRGQGYATADDVFRAVLRGDKALPGSREALAAAGPLDPVRGAMAQAGVPMTEGVQRRLDAQEEPKVAEAALKDRPPNPDPVAAGIERYGEVPDTYMSLRGPVSDLTQQQRSDRSQALKQSFTEAASREPQRRMLLLGRVTADGAASINAVLKAAGHDIDVSGFMHTADEYAARHTFKEHGNQAIEAARGNIAITADDWGRIPDILAAPDRVEYAGLNKIKNPVIRFTKFDGEQTYYVEEVLKGRSRLAAATL